MPTEPPDYEGLIDPAFLQWVVDNHGAPLRPDVQDCDPSAPAHTEEEAVAQYRLGQARKLIRLFHVWKAGQD